MTDNRECGEAILDYRTGKLWLDGQPFPYYIEADPEVADTDPAGVLFFVRIGILANRVTLISTDGEAETRDGFDAPDLHADDLAWARVEARRIVREGLAKWVTA